MNDKKQKDVLIVDDDKDICDIMKEYCSSMGCFKNIVVATDGAMASQKLRNQKFSLILLDINMPKKNGLDTILEIDTDGLNHKDSVIIVSGALEKETIAKVIQRGVKNFLVKPFNEESFQEKVLKVLSNTKA